MSREKNLKPEAKMTHFYVKVSESKTKRKLVKYGERLLVFHLIWPIFALICVVSFISHFSFRLLQF